MEFKATLHFRRFKVALNLIILGTRLTSVANVLKNVHVHLSYIKKSIGLYLSI